MINIKNKSEKISDIFYIISRISIGLFFFVAGFNKLFHPIFQERMFNTINNIGFPFPDFTANFTAFFECLSGFLLMIGLWTRVNSFILIIIILVALFSHDLGTIPTELTPVTPEIGIYNMDPFTWMGYFLYLPQVLYLLFLFQFISRGYVGYGVDSFIKKKIL